MGLPGHRRTSGDKRRRAAHFALTPKTGATCAKCGKVILSHRACVGCGTYKGRQVLNVAKRAHRQVKSAKAKK
ncbi:MAG: 50S ribosomal protein L32 [Candidatus Magasanikbacteria bacterium RIFOXYD2_FULL_41_14]|uniref:Large ribosomal subunit protein bL32 n=1 Tax=Candidatus Magasanikbacteria bacterium RIFOXYD2_FULL_41_14 TaxID=1798709 RepID=A0A1F6PC99_9BACT|nr:MAG: 50S ribosomal protein L32 [Candidatus Magasanikbacteria bacterium RIFOXYD2_FULL_41_14]